MVDVLRDAAVLHHDDERPQSLTLRPQGDTGDAASVARRTRDGPPDRNVTIDRSECHNRNAWGRPASLVSSGVHFCIDVSAGERTLPEIEMPAIETPCPAEEARRGRIDMRAWFVPPIVIPVGLLLLIAAVAVYHG
jgi:hypothetical protein